MVINDFGNPPHLLLVRIGHKFAGLSLSNTGLFFVFLKNSDRLFWKEDPTFLG